MADTIITTDGLTGIATSIREAQYETAIRDYQNKDYLADKLTQLNIAAESRSDILSDRLVDKATAVSQRTDDEIRSLDKSNEQRSVRSVDQINGRAEFLDIGAARRADASSLAAALNATNSANALERSTDRINDQTLKTENLLRDNLSWFQNESRVANTAAVLSDYATREAVRQEGAATRELINSQYTEKLRDQLAFTQNTLIELRGDVKHWEHEGRRWDRDFLNHNFNALANNVNSNLNALNSQLTSATQGTVNFGSMSGNAGRNTSTNNQV